MENKYIVIGFITDTNESYNVGVAENLNDAIKIMAYDMAELVNSYDENRIDISHIGEFTLSNVKDAFADISEVEVDVDKQRIIYDYGDYETILDVFKVV